MSQSLAQVWLHLVFSTQGRKAYLQRQDFRDEMHRMLSHHVKEAGCVPLQSGGWIDHVHVVCGLSRTMTISKLIEQLKTETSKWAKHHAHGVSTFSWQGGYGAFSVSHSLLDQTVTYVQNQAEHHRKMSFQEEFRLLCARHNVPLDERYVWD